MLLINCGEKQDPQHVGGLLVLGAVTLNSQQRGGVSQRRVANYNRSSTPPPSFWDGKLKEQIS